MKAFSFCRRWDYLVVLAIATLYLLFFYKTRHVKEPQFRTLFPQWYYTITDPFITNGSTITVKTPPDLCQRISTTALDCFSDFLSEALPSVILQFGFPPDKVPSLTAQAKPTILNVYALMLGGDDFPALEKRGILDIFASVGCGIFAAVALPGFVYSAAVFSAENEGRDQPIQDNQKFFVSPVHGDIATSAPVRFSYSATRSVLFPQFGAVGTTFNRDVYTIFPQALGMEDPNFIPLIRHILLHELTHVEQYRAAGYNLNDYGLNYLFHYCKAGFSYSGNQLEQEAVATKTNGDAGLGFPIVRTFTTITNVRFGPTMELEFEFGLMQIISQTSFRTFTAAETDTKGMAECTHLPPCRPRVRCMPPDRLPTKIDICDPGDIKDFNAACDAAKRAWVNLDMGLFTPFDVLPPPPPPVPGWPATCQMLSKVPRGAKSCQFDTPPPGCDWDFVDENNKDCKAQRAKCRQ